MVYPPRRADVSGGEGDAGCQLARPTVNRPSASTCRAIQQGRVANAFDLYTKRENTSVKMKRTLTSKDKEIITEFLLIYKDSQCLWDTSQRCYYNREQRNEAYVKLLAKYQEYDEDATCDTVRNKIENIRSAYRRERKKVLTAIRDCEIHKPVLWYYDLMSFLDGGLMQEWDGTNNKRTFAEIQNRESDTSIENEANDILNSTSHSPPGDDDTTHSTIPKNSSEKKYFVEEEVDGKLSTQPGTQIETCYDGDLTTAFGKMVGLQLKELALQQRIIAEKLISDIIFNARLNRLSAQPPYHNFK